MLLQNGRVGNRMMLRRQWRGCTLPAAALAALIFAGIILGDTNQSSAQEQAPWAPKLYAFDFDGADTKRRSLLEEARMLRELGFDGVGYVLWLEEGADIPLRRFGENLDKNLRTLDEAGLPVFGLGAPVNVDPNASPYDPRLVEVIRKLKGRPLIIGVMLTGLPAGDERGTKPAVKILRQLGDLAAESDLRISVYHHFASWAQGFEHTLRVVNEADHPRVGLNFNVAHWLMVEGDKDYRPLLRNAADKIFIVTINGAKVGGTTVEELAQPLDRGDFDNRQLLAILRDMGYRGPIGLQGFVAGDAREHLRRSMKVWKAWEEEWEKEPR